MVQLVCLGQTEAQVGYTFSHKMEAYTELTGGTTLTGVIPAVPVPFPFTLAGTTNDTIFLMYQNIKTDYSSSSASFTAFGAELVNGVRSYEVTGAMGQRILKVQYKDMNFAHDFNLSDTINYQVWFFEADDAVEVHFGRSNIQNAVWSYYYNESGPYVGLYQFVGSVPYNYTLKGDPAAPAADSATGRLQGTPSNGQVYRFAPQTSGVAEPRQFSASVYPNPSKGSFYVVTHRQTTCDIRIWNTLGRVVYYKARHNTGELLQTALPPGVYVLEAEGGKARVVLF
jgi:hypothetical protein